MKLLPPFLMLSLVACAPPPCDENSCRPSATAACEVGLDTNKDGLCDRSVADWSANATLPEAGHRRDIYDLGPALNDVRARGLQHFLSWPVNVSGVLLPNRPMQALLDPNTPNAKTKDLQGAARTVLGFGTTPEMYEYLGLPTRDASAEAQPGVPWPDWVKPGDRLGVGTVMTEHGEAMTFSCATCHAANLFGRTVVGLTNRKEQANEFFHKAAGFFPLLDADVFVKLMGADRQELQRFLITQKHLGAVGSKTPQVRGLDTSLAQVSLSLARRTDDENATRDATIELSPRPNQLETFVADSKPAVWWTTKYKTRWLSDGSIVSGNPIFTNFLWNEIGRGTDLDALQGWLTDNRHVVDELTVMVFATEAPKWVDFFGAASLDVEAAKRGEQTFLSACASCHGTYEKNWSDGTQTTRVRYHPQTPVMDVGTSPQRAQGMAAFSDALNKLTVSKWMKTVVEVQSGYVPPPLDGVWARYPYLHNQSVPTLCELLGPPANRTAVFYMGDDADPAVDYDPKCVGLPVGDKVPAHWKTDARRKFDTSIPGLSNQGHVVPPLSVGERDDLIEFLKTL
ncbi:MAG: hypothetical protein DI536_28655 [Archangium gephyra]|uniref:Cytochrome c domain-containing protein n=1 Tax=Archangium gephyra TaxID=48 RepID=A0A2W5UEB3_9BACT|nr:MAG: hypothetical protein DI536_28655 [Archangium gephyra]